VIRAGVESDVRAIVEFGRDVIPSHYAPLIGPAAAEAQVRDWWGEAFIMRAVAAGNVVVLFVDDRLAGVGQIGRNGDDFAIYKLYLRPELRGRGLGAELIAALIDSLPAHTTRVSVEHFAANSRAGAFYERRGFTVDRIEPDSGGDPSLDVVWRSRALGECSG
jgi:GNAT superfamily N-acetyltransferase